MKHNNSAIILMSGKDFKAIIEAYGLSQRELSQRWEKSEKFVYNLTTRADVPLKWVDKLRQEIGESRFLALLESVRRIPNKLPYRDRECREIVALLMQGKIHSIEEYENGYKNKKPTKRPFPQPPAKIVMGEGFDDIETPDFAEGFYHG